MSIIALRDKVAIVTGSAVGIGREIALAYGREGAKVVVNFSKSVEEADETARLVTATGAEAIVVQADVTVAEQAQRLIDTAVARFGRLDVLVNNAGATRFVDFSDLDGLTEEVWDSLFAVNVKGAFWCARAAAKVMQAQSEGGAIINIVSQAGLRPAGSSIAYCVAKAGEVHLTLCLAKALGPAIRVNAIAPGFIAETRWNVGRPNLAAAQAAAANAALLKRVGYPADIAEAAVFLGGAGAYVTGHVLVVDGGRIWA
jgi:NAD(P)-dependent dehydrogenase (short-subunit alcohol dehydrogenase family)